MWGKEGVTRALVRGNVHVKSCMGFSSPHFYQLAWTPRRPSSCNFNAVTKVTANLTGREARHSQQQILATWIQPRLVACQFRSLPMRDVRLNPLRIWRWYISMDCPSRIAAQRLKYGFLNLGFSQVQSLIQPNETTTLLSRWDACTAS